MYLESYTHYKLSLPGFLITRLERRSCIGGFPSRFLGGEHTTGVELSAALVDGHSSTSAVGFCMW